MTDQPARRFPPPWEVHEATESFCIRDANGQALAYVYFEDVRSTGQCNTACSLSAGVWKPKVFRGR